VAHASSCRVLVPSPPRLAFAGLRLPLDVIVLAMRCYLRYGLSHHDVEELLAERGVEVDHVTIFRWVQRFAPLLAEAARPCRHAIGDRLQLDETYVRMRGHAEGVHGAGADLHHEQHVERAQASRVEVEEVTASRLCAWLRSGSGESTSLPGVCGARPAAWPG
jgi:hypothetical protein